MGLQHSSLPVLSTLHILIFVLVELFSLWVKAGTPKLGTIILLATYFGLSLQKISWTRLSSSIIVVVTLFITFMWTTLLLWLPLVHYLATPF